MADHDYDWLVLGSGFGGSVSALRLAEKGYRVGVLECGRRFRDEDFAETTWQLSRYYWMPKLGLKGILRLTLFRDIFIASGCGVGGGSLGYANTLYRARPAFYRDRLEELWGIFGENRLIYGSDWPNSDNWAEYPKGFRVVHEFFSKKGQAAAEKYFWKNSLAAYKWVHRDASQPV